MIPGLMLEGIVEDQRAALLPMADLLVDADRDLVGIGRHLEAEMQAQDAVIGAAMGRQMLARLEDREHRRPQTRYFLDDAPGFRTKRGVIRGGMAIAGEEERLPAGIGADRR